MKTVTVHKAQGIGKKTVKSVAIILDQEAPNLPTLAEHAAFYQAEADRIVDTLIWSLPGGTVDQVLCKLLQRRASLFVVPLFDGPKGGDA